MRHVLIKLSFGSLVMLRFIGYVAALELARERPNDFDADLATPDRFRIVLSGKGSRSYRSPAFPASTGQFRALG